jgi:DNA polymerase
VEEFRAGRDLYKVEAAGTFGCGYEEVSKAQRQVGKVEILSLGYGGGIAAFAAMAGNYGIDLETLPALVFPGANSDEREQALRTAAGFLQRNPAAMSTDAAMACDIIKQKWRAKNTRIVRFWAALGEAASSAVESPGKVFSYRKVSFRTWKDPVGNNYLVCRLPSGRYLYYFGPKIRAMKTPWGDLKDVLTYHGVDGVTRRWVIQKAPGFLLCENIVQAACRDLLADAMVRVEAAGYPVVLHVHDELVSEVDEDFGSLEAYEKLMAASPEWARGLPVQAVGWRGKRYRKE